MPNQCTKFEVSSASRCGDITWGVKFENGLFNLDYAPFREDFFRQGGTCYGKPMYRYEAVNGGAKCRKWGG